MKGFLALASDFIGQLSAPGARPEVSEAYEVRLASILEADRELLGDVTRLSRELTAQDVPLLPKVGWQWLLRLLATQSARPPDAFLDALFDTTAHTVTRLRIIEAVTSLPLAVEAFHSRRREGPLTVQNFPESWLGHRLQDIVVDRRDAGRLEAVSRAYDLVFLLMQVGNELALAAARTLLAHGWSGREQLRHDVGAFFEGQDEETHAAWRERLGL